MKDLESYQLAFGVGDITSDAMKDAIEEWFELYYTETATSQSDSAQQIPYTIVRKLTKTVFSEYWTAAEEGFAKRVLAALAQKQNQALQLALVGGECYLKPVMGEQISFGVIPRTQVLVFGRDGSGTVTDMGTVERCVQGKYYYTLLERRTVDADGFLTIRNMLLRSGSEYGTGQQVPLTELKQYAALPEEYTFQERIGSVGLVCVKTPVLNCVDGSADGVSVYAAAVGLIRAINRNMAQLNGEFDRGMSRIVVSADMLQRDSQGNYSFDDAIFVGLDEDPETVGVTAFTPQLREQSYLAREQALLRSVENVIGLKRGLLSAVEAEERTATEITSSEGEYQLTVMDFQRMWEGAVREALRLCGVLGRLYRVPGAKEIAEDTVTIGWGNGVLYDEEKVRQRMLSEVQAGLLLPERYLGYVYGLPCDTEEQRKAIRGGYMPGGGED